MSDAIRVMIEKHHILINNHSILGTVCPLWVISFHLPHNSVNTDSYSHFSDE